MVGHSNHFPALDLFGGRPLNARILVLGVLVASLVLVTVLCFFSRSMRLHRQVRRFRKTLVDIESVALSWSTSSLGRPLSDVVPDRLPAMRRLRRGRRHERDGGADPPV